MLRKDLRSITEMEFSESLRIEELEASDLPALFEFNRRRCDSKANGRAVADVEQRLPRATPATSAASSWATTGGWTAGSSPGTATSSATGSRSSSTIAAVYGFDFFLLEEHRGGGNSVEFLHKVETRLRDLGYETLWGYVVADNKPARWLYSMCGYEPVRRVAARPGAREAPARRCRVGVARDAIPRVERYGVGR